MGGIEWVFQIGVGLGWGGGGLDWVLCTVCVSGGFDWVLLYVSVGGGMGVVQYIPSYRKILLHIYDTHTSIAALFTFSSLPNSKHPFHALVSHANNATSPSHPRARLSPKASPPLRPQ